MIAVIGGTVVLIGVAGLVLPILPGWVLIFAGVGVLATEFAWARWVLKVSHERMKTVLDQVRSATATSRVSARENIVPTNRNPAATPENPN